MPRPKPTTAASPTRPALSSGWAWVRFDEVARNVADAESKPLAAGLTRFVGLEHLEPRDLRIRSWGNVADGTTFSRVFRAGQVLFGKRRAYQRKAAVPDFDGVCSGDIYVFAANEDRLIPELLPFLVQSEGFAAHAENTSEGSLSPRTKWKYLAEYAFPLPTAPAEQRRIAELLRADDDAVEAWQAVTDHAQQTKLAVVSDELGRHEGQAALADVLTGPIESGYSQPPIDEVTGHYILALNALSRTG